MQTDFDAQTRTIHLQFETEAQLRTYLTKSENRGLFLVRLSDALQVGQQLSMLLSGGDAKSRVEATVQQVFRSGSEHGIALSMEDSSPSAIRNIGSESPVASSPPPAEAKSPSDDRVEKPEATDSTGAATATEIRGMNVSQKIRLASRAGRIERQILLRDNSPQVLMVLLTNPRIDEQEVRELVRSPHAASGVLQHVAKDRRWSTHYEVRLSLVKNPKTPTPIAQRLLPSLRKTDLQSLAKSTQVREAIKGAALRLYLDKM